MSRRAVPITVTLVGTLSPDGLDLLAEYLRDRLDAEAQRPAALELVVDNDEA